MRRHASSSSVLVVVFVAVFLDMLAVGLIVPLLPLHIRALGATVEQVGWIGTAYGTMQLIGGALMGRMSDLHGRKKLLLISFIGPFFGYAMLSIATSLWMVVLSRIPVGLLKQTISVSQSLVSDVTTEQQRAAKLGLLGLFAGVGLIIGPALSGYLLEWHGSAPAVIASLFYIVNFTLVAVFLPSDANLQKQRDQRLGSDDSPAVSKLDMDTRSVDSTTVAPPAPSPHPKLTSVRQHIDDFIAFSRRELEQSVIRRLLLACGAINISSFLLLQNTIPMQLQDEFGLTTGGAGLMMSYGAFLYAFTQAALVPILTSRYSEKQLITVLFLVSGVSMVVTPYCTQLYMFVIAFSPTVCAGGVAQTCIVSSLTKNANMDDSGGTIGLSGAVEALCRASAPALAGILIFRLGYRSPWLVGALTCFFAAHALRDRQGQTWTRTVAATSAV